MVRSELGERHPYLLVFSVMGLSQRNEYLPGHKLLTLRQALLPLGQLCGCGLASDHRLIVTCDGWLFKIPDDSSCCVYY